MQTAVPGVTPPVSKGGPVAMWVDTTATVSMVTRGGVAVLHRSPAPRHPLPSMTATVAASATVVVIAVVIVFLYNGAPLSRWLAISEKSFKFAVPNHSNFSYRDNKYVSLSSLDVFCFPPL